MCEAVRSRTRGRGRLSAALLAMLILAGLLAGCRTPPPGRFRRATLSGLVADSRGRPVTGALVELDGRRSQITGSDGRFAFDRVRRGTRRISVRRRGFEPARVELSFSDRRELAYVRLVSRQELLARAGDALEAGDTTLASGLLDRAGRLTDPGTAADLRVLRAVLRARRGQPRAAVRELAPLRDDPGTRGEAEALVRAIRDAASRTR